MGAEGPAAPDGGGTTATTTSTSTLTLTISSLGCADVSLSLPATDADGRPLSVRSLTAAVSAATRIRPESLRVIRQADGCAVEGDGPAWDVQGGAVG